MEVYGAHVLKMHFNAQEKLALSLVCFINFDFILLNFPESYEGRTGDFVLQKRKRFIFRGGPAAN